MRPNTNTDSINITETGSELGEIKQELEVIPETQEKDIIYYSNDEIEFSRSRSLRD